MNSLRTLLRFHRALHGAGALALLVAATLCPRPNVVPSVHAETVHRSPSPTASPPTSVPTSAPTPISTLTSDVNALQPEATVAAQASQHMYGTLLTDPSKAAQEVAAGVRVAELELGWDDYEPQDGVFSSTYAAQAKAKLKTFQDAGMQVVLGLGLQYPPAWVFKYPNSRYVNQYGVASKEVNLTFNLTLRQKAEAYMNRVAQDLGGGNFWAVRIGSGGNIELLYPQESEGGTNSYWAYDGAAQTGAGLTGGISVNPFPGWKPGNKTYKSKTFTTAQVTQWYTWYLNAMVDTVNWQIAAYKKYGYTGFMQVLMPGLGSRPSEYQSAIAHYLNGTGDSNETMGRGAVWDRVIARIDDHNKLVVYISSMADGSGNNDLCSPNDSSVSISDPRVENWSATRWISYNANRYGLLKNGENAGENMPTYGPGMMTTAAKQMQACGLQGIMWEHDWALYNNTTSLSLATYKSTISQYP